MKLKLLFFFAIIAFNAFSQSPKLINYQGAARRADGSPIANRNLGVKFEILEGAGSGTVVSSETQTVITNVLGLFSAQIGKSGLNFAAVNWQNSPHRLQISIDTTGGTNNFIGTFQNQMTSTPFAFNADDVPSTYTNNILTIGKSTYTIVSAVTPSINTQGVISSTNSGSSFTLNVPNPTLSLNGSSLSISNGNTVTLPSQTSQTIVPQGALSLTAGLNSFTLSTPAQISQTISGNGMAVVQNGVNTATVSVPNPTLIINSNSLSINGGNTVILPGQIAQTISAQGVASVTNGVNSAIVAVPNPVLSNTANILSISQGTAVSTVTMPAVSNASFITSGVVGISTISANSFSVNVPAPVLTNTANLISISQGTASSTITVPITHTISSAGIAAVTPSVGSVFTVSVPAPTLIANSNTLTLTQGTVTSTVSVPAQITQSITGAGIASVTSPASNSFVVTVNQPTYAYSQSNGSLTSGTSSANITPNLTFTNNVLTSGPASNSVTINAGWGLSGNAGTSSLTNFIGTTDSNPIIFKVNNQRAGVIDQSGPVFLGYQAGNSNTITTNTGIGFNALFSNTSGNNNTAIGNRALFSNTTGGNNDAFGWGALQFNTTGSNNSASGSAALYSNTSGGNNSAFGMSALTANTAGNSNAAFGMSALSANTTGANNTAMGMGTMINNTIGSQNSAFGQGALGAVTSGSYNTALGYGTGAATTSGSLNVFLGYQAGYFETGSNKLYISNSTTSTTPLIYGNFSSGKVAIGNANATEALDVTGNVKFSGALMPNNAAGTTGQLLMSQGTGSAPVWTTQTTGWGLTGNAGTTPSLNFIGTTDNKNLNFKVNNQIAGAIDFTNQNTFFGYLSGSSSPTTQGNTAIGTNAGKLISTGGFNTALGWGALTSNTSGQQNVSLGFSAMSANVSGGFNSIVGMYALTSNTAGSSNSALGWGAGYNNMGSNNVFLGNSAGYYETGSNKLYISNSTTSTTPLIYGDFSTGRVGINTSTGTANFQVNGTTRLVDGSEGAGKVLTSDASGNATWSTVAAPSRVRSIVVEPGAMNITGAYAAAPATYSMVGGWQRPCVVFPDAAITQIQLHFAIPSDWNAASSFTVRILYGSPGTSGIFDMQTLTSNIGLNASAVTSSSGGAFTLSQSGTAEGLSEYQYVMAITSTSKVLQFTLRRNGNSGTDTSTDPMRLYGIAIDYRD